MAKPGAGKKTREPSKHSRAARRATTLDIDTDKSLKDVKPPSESTDYRPAVLQAHHGAGVSKKASNRRSILSSKARKRKAKGADRAEAILERTASKVQKSKGQARAIQERSKGWEDINKEAPAQDMKKFPTEEDLADEDADADAGDGAAAAAAEAAAWETDEEMDAADADANVSGTASGVAFATATAGAPLPKDDDDDEIL